MNIKKIALASIVFISSSFTLNLQDEDLLIGSTSASSSHYGYFVAVGKLITENAKGIKASIVETGATIDNINRIGRGQLDLGLVTTNVVQHATVGKNKFNGKPQDLQLLWVYVGAPQNVVVRKDSQVKNLAGLANVRFNPCIKGSATEATTEAVFKTLGLTADFVRGSTTDIVGSIKDNRLAGYVKSGAGQRLDGSSLDIASSIPISILGLSNKQKTTLIKEMPDISVVDIPSGAAEGLPAYSTWSFGVGVAASSKLSEDAAYKIVKAIMEDKTAQGEAMASVKGANLAERTLKFGTIALHPGAAKWFSENGYKLPVKLQSAQ